VASLGSLAAPTAIGHRSSSAPAPQPLGPHAGRGQATLDFRPTARPLRAKEEPTSERLRAELLDVGTSFAGLDRRVEEDRRRRKEIEHRRVQELLGVLGKLERTLNVEIARREDATRSMQQAVDELLEGMVTHVQGRIMERFGQLSRSVESLCERCSTVERGIRQLKGELPSKLQVESARQQHRLRELAEEFQADRRRRLERDAQLQRAIEEVEYGVDLQVQRELAQVERQIEALQELIDEFASAESSEENNSRRASIFGVFDAFREDLKEEAASRERADDQLVQAINEYTSTLHRSLSAANA